jgi:translation initiation factor 1
MAVVYSTDRGRVCPKCGWPSDNCQCSKPADEPVPAKVTPRLRVEKSGRAGKIVTVIADLPRNAAFLNDLARQLKRHCGTGGTVVDNAIELQGDQRDRARAWLRAKNYTVKG